VVGWHAIDPQPPARVRLGVIRAARRVLRHEREHGVESPRLRIEHKDRVLAQDEEIAVVAKCDGTHGLADFDGLIAPGSGIEGVHDAAKDVHPPQDAALGVPQRPLAEIRMRIHDEPGRPESGAARLETSRP
jgi:hypothetical protein